MSKTINLYFYDKCKEIAIGDTVTIFRAAWGEHLGERAIFTKLTERYAEFTTPSGAVVKVYNYGKHVGGNMYLGHYPAGGFREHWRVTPDAEEKIQPENVRYQKHNTKSGNFEWKNR